ncbi:hypothetical protein FE251_09720 [Georgenia wutianyii]|uniref:DUF5666 domain-containing protein n=1 Tax=Georgenia wutianyii TaxID=2585135 RepID=A0ABX5VRA9_9MICO|nr:hypothetical protein [Georgenia wutianyii]QDB79619.1 hypothetical protein FE251_09720 [Georgenia wutianyii]
MRRIPLALSLVALLSLSACGTEDTTQQPAETVTATAAPTKEEKPSPSPAPVKESPAATEDASEELADGIVIREAGVGQEGEYARAVALVETRGYVGEFLTVHFNVFDADDELIASGEQVEVIASEAGTFAVGTMVDVGAARAARVEATHAISDYGMGGKALPTIEPAPVTLGDYGLATIRLTNPTSEPWENLRIGIVCRNAEGAIVGGGDSYPSLVPANAESMADGYVIAGDGVTECTAYPQHTTW